MRTKKWARVVGLSLFLCFALLGAGCAAGGAEVEAVEVAVEEGESVEEESAPAVQFQSWLPAWSSGYKPCNQGGLSVIQGLEGYSLIAGKDTLVAFNPPLEMVADARNARLAAYKIEPQGVEFPIASGIPNAPVDGRQGDSGWADQCAALNFIVDGETVRATGDYLFVVSWYDLNNRPHENRIVARFHAPAVLKVLTVPINMADLSASERNSTILDVMGRFFARMPVAADALEERGAGARYWDLYPESVSVDEGALHAAGCAPHDLCQFRPQIGAALQDYNASASIKADLAIGIYIRKAFEGIACSGAGCASGNVAVCDASPGTCTHEIGHMLNVTEESWDRYAASYTCGYFDDDTAAGCREWGWDAGTHSMVRAANIMSYRELSLVGFYTRHFYESLCLYYGGGCLAVGSFRLKPLDGARYLVGDMHSGAVTLAGAEIEARPLWNIANVRTSGKHTYGEIHLYAPGVCNDCPFELLAGNTGTGAVVALDPAYVAYQPGEFETWCTEWEIEQLAAGIITLECGAGWFLTWDETSAEPALSQRESSDAEHWTPAFQWRVVKASTHFGYPP